MLLQEGGANNIFSELTRAQFRDTRQTIVQAILGTDMSSHMEHCAHVFQFAQKAERRSTDEERGGAGRELESAESGLAAGADGELDGVAVQPPPPWRVFSVEKPEDRSFLTKTIVHWCVGVLLSGGGCAAEFRCALALPRHSLQLLTVPCGLAPPPSHARGHVPRLHCDDNAHSVASGRPALLSVCM